ncbi:excisionase family DNA-binding protein [Kushneria aurantia]|uniref:Excisionase family DNA-binding protein n=1 Tax=Kushneria aurantia TaxID=504092 RepID=A0ABV6G2R7_9GAMM|nr:excisionase family DNA-binding protein [Kushneria aurantia]
MEQEQVTPQTDNHPIMTLELFASRTGVTVPTVRAWVHNGDIPSVKVGKRRLVNMVGLIRDLIDDEGGL